MPGRLVAAVKLGTALPSYCDGRAAVPAETLTDWATTAEDAGVAGLWVMDHLVQPDPYRTTVLDPLVTLGHAAAATDRISLGTSVMLLPLRRTAAVASQAASLQQLSGGRLTLGFGAGYVPEEFEVTGVPIEERGPRLNEGMAVLRRLFDGAASFDGRFHEFEDVRVDPVPETPPRMLAGGSGRDAGDGDREFRSPIVDRILAADGWVAPPVSPATARGDWELLAEEARERDRDPGDLDRVLLNYVHLVDSDDPETAEAEQREAFESFFAGDDAWERAREHSLVGTTEEVVAALREYEAMGFDQVVLGPAAREPDALATQLDRIVTDLLPEFDRVEY